MGIQGNRLIDIQQCYFDVCDLLNGQSYKDIGYDSRKEMLEEFKERLARIEDAYKEACGIKEDADTYECVCCEKQHTQEFSLTCPECDSERESGGLERCCGLQAPLRKRHGASHVRHLTGGYTYETIRPRL